MAVSYLVDPQARRITEIETDGWKTIEPYLPGGLDIGMVFENGDVLYVDGEALLRPATMAFRIKRRPDGQPMMSKGVLDGRDTLDTTLPPCFTIAELQDEIEWLTVGEALQWFRGKAGQPAVTTTHAGEPRQVHALWDDLLRNLEGGRGYDPRTSESVRAAIERP